MDHKFGACVFVVKVFGAKFHIADCFLDTPKHKMGWVKRGKCTS